MSSTRFHDPRINWSNHWSHGGTGVTRNSRYGDSDKLYEAIAESVKLFGDPKIWMEDGINELHSSKRDLSAFWAFHKSRKAPSDPSGTEKHLSAPDSTK